MYGTLPCRKCAGVPNYINLFDQNEVIELVAWEGPIFSLDFGIHLDQQQQPNRVYHTHAIENIQLHLQVLTNDIIKYRYNIARG